MSWDRLRALPMAHIVRIVPTQSREVAAERR